MLGHRWTWPEFYSFLKSQSFSDDTPGLSSGSGESSNTLFEDNWYYVTVKNPSFGFDDVVRHVYHDKVGDLSRTTNIGAGVNLALAPITPYMIAAGPAGIATRAALSVGGTVFLAGYANTADSYRDLVNIATTKEVGGTRLYGHSVRSR
jgi:hypothetical protein